MTQQPGTPFPIINPAAPGYIGGAPYGDLQEVTGPPQFISEVEPYGEFFRTDARSVLLVVHPQHYNFIPNPSFREGMDGWEASGLVPVPTPDFEVTATSDAVANSASLTQIRSVGTEGSEVHVTEVDKTPLLKTAQAWYNAASVGSDRFYDISGNSRDAVFGAGTAAPVILPYSGTTYMAVPTGSVSNNHLSGIVPNIPGTATLEWDIETMESLGTNGFNLIYQTARDGAIYVSIQGTGEFRVNTWVGGVTKALQWPSAVAVNTRKKYRLELTTTGGNLYIDGVNYQGPKSFSATRVPVANSDSQMLMTNGAGSPTIYKVYSFNLYGALIFDPTRHTNYATVTNIGSQGGTWTINRPVTGYKTTIVDRPLVLFGEAQTATITGYRPNGDTNPMTAIIAVRDTTASGNASNMFIASTGNSTQVGWLLYKPSGLSYMTTLVKDGTQSRSIGISSPTPRNNIAFGLVMSKGSSIPYLNDGTTSTKGTTTTTPVLTTTVPDVDLAIGGNPTLKGSFSFIGAAVWDRALTDAEVAQASKELLGVPPPSPVTNVYDYLLDSASTIPEADVPFPVTGNLVGYKVRGAPTPDDALDPSDSWVGQSLSVGGSGMVRYRDGGHFVYVGYSKEHEGLDWFEHGRSSSQWTFSAFFKGTGKVRLVMDAYTATSDAVMAPPFGPDLRTVANPSAEPWTSDAYIKDSDDIVWVRRGAPYYLDIGRPPIIAAPGSLTSQDYKYVLDTQAIPHLWEAIYPKPPTGSLYIDRGETQAYTDVATNPDDDPAVINPHPSAPKPLLVTSSPADPMKDGHVWVLPSLPYYTSTGTKATIASMSTEWQMLQTDDWVRLYIQTAARTSDDRAYNFGGCRWIDARIEFEEADNMRISSLMLDPTEYPIASYFDGSMTEDPGTDDFMWSGAENDSISEYYYDRIVRTKWLYENIQHFVPVGRPYQIYFGDFSRPYTPPGAKTLSTEGFAL